MAQEYYTGKKESEQENLQNLLEKAEASAQKITADALHLNPKTTEKIAKAGGIFLIGLKANQKKLLADMMGYFEHLKPVYQ